VHIFGFRTKIMNVHELDLLLTTNCENTDSSRHFKTAW